MTWKQAAQKAQQSKVKPIPEGWSTTDMIAKEIGSSNAGGRRVKQVLSMVKHERKLWPFMDKIGRVQHRLIYRLK